MVSYRCVQVTNKVFCQHFFSFIGMANVFKGICSILPYSRQNLALSYRPEEHVTTYRPVQLRLLPPLGAKYTHRYTYICRSDVRNRHIPHSSNHNESTMHDIPYLSEKLCNVINFPVNHHPQILLRIVLGHFGHGNKLNHLLS